MPNTVRLILALHNHQPVGNFDNVFEQAYQDSYRPFLEVFSRYPSLKIALHTSGPLMEWLDANHPEYIDQLGELVADGRVEILGGAFYEPILTMLPDRDRVGQIYSYSQWLENRLGAEVRGMWVPERVWEQSLVPSIANAKIEYSVLDDFHFKSGGIPEEDLFSYFITEDQGKNIAIFPGSEKLRYLVPFQDPQETVDYLADIGSWRQNSIVVFGDDGEKFGTWPNTHQHVYGDRWLERFFDALVQNESWIKTTTFAEARDNVPPQGKVYLPDCSYREMTEWVLPAKQGRQLDKAVHELEELATYSPEHRQISDPNATKRFLRGGIWRNFKVKYPETDEMYSRMMLVSNRLEDAYAAGLNAELLDRAKRELYRGQCNCSYWHGAFGGIYLPHLRNAVFTHLIRADKIIDEAFGREKSRVEIVTDDVNFDGHPEILLSNSHLLSLFEPSKGGRLTELDVFPIEQNLLASLTRREETYHDKVRGGEKRSDGVSTIHGDDVVFKHPNLDKLLRVDTHPRKSFLDLFYSHNATLAQVEDGQAAELGGLFNLPYEARVRRSADRHQVLLSRDVTIEGCTFHLDKVATLSSESKTLELAYRFEGLPRDRSFHFAAEMNFAAMPAGADDRYFTGPNGERLGQLGEMLDLHDCGRLCLTDEWLGITVAVQPSFPTYFWTFPIGAVSQSEGGYEMVHQSVCVLPHWYIQGDENGIWQVNLDIELDTSQAESRMLESAEVGA